MGRRGDGDPAVAADGPDAPAHPPAEDAREGADDPWRGSAGNTVSAASGQLVSGSSLGPYRFSQTWDRSEPAAGDLPPQLGPLLVHDLAVQRHQEPGLGRARG